MQTQIQKVILDKKKGVINVSFKIMIKMRIALVQHSTVIQGSICFEAIFRFEFSKSLEIRRFTR